MRRMMKKAAAGAAMAALVLSMSACSGGSERMPAAPAEIP